MWKLQCLNVKNCALHHETHCLVCKHAIMVTLHGTSLISYLWSSVCCTYGEITFFFPPHFCVFAALYVKQVLRFTIQWVIVRHQLCRVRIVRCAFVDCLQCSIHALQSLTSVVVCAREASVWHILTPTSWNSRARMSRASDNASKNGRFLMLFLILKFLLILIWLEWSALHYHLSAAQQYSATILHKIGMHCAYRHRKKVVSCSLLCQILCLPCEIEQRSNFPHTCVHNSTIHKRLQAKFSSQLQWRNMLNLLAASEPHFGT